MNFHNLHYKTQNNDKIKQLIKHFYKFAKILETIQPNKLICSNLTEITNEQSNHQLINVVNLY